MDELQQQIVEWQNPPLDRVYPIVFVDGLRVFVRTEKGVLKKCVYTVLGVDTDGRQEVLGLWMEETEGARFWLKVLNDLKARGVEDVLTALKRDCFATIVCGDGLTGLPHAVECAYPQADVQLCVVHHVRNVTKFVSWKDRKALCADRRPIYTAPTIEAAESALEQFGQNWSKRYPTRWRLGAVIGLISPPSSVTRWNCAASSTPPTRLRACIPRCARTLPAAL